MGSKICMNPSCRTANTHDWKKGWPLRFGGFAHLCSKCGTAFENLVYCHTFHSGETGWRNCSLCNKPLHCGCVVSRSLYKCLDSGGVGCIGCTDSYQPHVVSVPNEHVVATTSPSKGSTLSRLARLQNSVIKSDPVRKEVEDCKLTLKSWTVDVFDVRTHVGKIASGTPNLCMM